MSLQKQYARIGVVALIERDSRILAIQRSAEVVAPLKWCLPGGGIEPGESQEDAVKREIQEELGIHVLPVECLMESETPWNVLLYWWRVRVTDEELLRLKPEPREVADVRWMTISELYHHPDTLQSNLEPLQKIGGFQNPH